MDRRRFLVTLQGVVVGAFAMPADDPPESPADIGDFDGSDVATGSAVGGTGADGADVYDILVPPSRSVRDDGNVMLVYVRGDGEVMVWYSDSEEERAEIERFYQATRVVGCPQVDPQEVFPIRRNPRERALLDAIVEDYDDPARRLQYADFLTRRGDPLGEFVRLDLRTDEMSGEEPEWEEASARWGALLESHARDWMRPLAALRVWPVLYGTVFSPRQWIRGGLIAEVEIRVPGVLPEQADRLLDAAPVLERLVLAFDGIDVPAIARLPLLRQIRSFETTCEGDTLEVDDLAAFLDSPHLGRLRELNWNSNTVGVEGAGLLAASPLLERLERLQLQDCGLDAQAVQALVHAAPARRLKSLDLDRNELDADGIAALVGSGAFPSLAELSLASCGLDSAALRAFAAAPESQRIEVLDLEGNGIDDLSALAAWSGRGGLKWLDLSGNPIGPAGAAALSEIDGLDALQWVRLDKCGLDDESVRRLVRTPWWSRTTEMAFEGNAITAAGVRYLLDGPLPPHVESLGLSGNPIGEEGAILLARSPRLKSVGSLSVDAESVGETGGRLLLERFGEDVVRLV